MRMMTPARLIVCSAYFLALYRVDFSASLLMVVSASPSAADSMETYDTLDNVTTNVPSPSDGRESMVSAPFLQLHYSNRALRPKKSKSPSQIPSSLPTQTSKPSNFPSNEPTIFLSNEPSLQPSECIDEPDWQVGGNSVYKTMNCTDIEHSNKTTVEDFCRILETKSDGGPGTKSISQACCSCGGGSHHTIFPSQFPTSSPSVSNAPTQPTMKPTSCTDEPGWTFTSDEDEELGCDALVENRVKMCQVVSTITYKSKSASLACCVCGGGIHLSVEPSGSPTSQPSSEPSNEPTVTSKPSIEPTSLPSQDPSDIPSTTPSSPPTISMMPSDLPSMSFAAAFDGDYCRFDRECKDRPLYSKSRISINQKRPKKTKSPSSMPSMSPSISPTNNPSSQPSTFPSIMPSSMPSTSPSSFPSSSPSEYPSDFPSTAPSTYPTEFPSVKPSPIPTTIPSSSPSRHPSSAPSESPTISVNPSLLPTNAPSVSALPSSAPQQHGRCVENTCTAEDLMVKINNSQSSATFKGSYGNHKDGADNDGTYDQDYAGGAVVHRDPYGDTITLFGNAWKAYTLAEQYEVTKSSFLEFSFTATEEAEGHAICLDEDLNEDTFGSTQTRCVMLAGSQVEKWDAVVKYNIGAISGSLARQSSDFIFDIGDADRAIDGDIKPFWMSDYGGTFNSISRTGKEDYPWWEVVLKTDADADDLEATLGYEIHDVIIHNRQDASFIDVLSNFTVSIYDNISEDETGLVWNETFAVTEAFNKFHIAVPREDSAIIGKRLRIKLNKAVASLHLTEVEIMGKEAGVVTQQIRIPIGHLFAGSEMKVKYISFIQDNDNESTVGESEFSDIQLITEDPTLVIQKWKNNKVSVSDESTSVFASLDENKNAVIELSGDRSAFGLSWTVRYDSSDSSEVKVEYNTCNRDAGHDIDQKEASVPRYDDYHWASSWSSRLGFKRSIIARACLDGSCGRCKGNCYNNKACKDGLVCQTRDESDEIGRGCGDNDDMKKSRWNYCVLPEALRRVSCSIADVEEGELEMQTFDSFINSTDHAVGVPQNPTSIAVSLAGTIVVGYSKFQLEYIVPSPMPSEFPSGVPSTSPSSVPSSFPSVLPSMLPSRFPSTSPSEFLSAVPSGVPSGVPVSLKKVLVDKIGKVNTEPTTEPSLEPFSVPSLEASTESTAEPTVYNEYPPVIDGLFRGSIVIYSLIQNETTYLPYEENENFELSDDDKNQTLLESIEWERETYSTKRNGHLLGEFQDTDCNNCFGSAVAVSADGEVVAVGSPDYLVDGNKGRVKVLTRSGDGSWQPLGGGGENGSGFITYGRDPTVINFGMLLALSDDGTAIAIRGNKQVGTEQFVSIFQLNAIDSDWETIGDDDIVMDSDVDIVALGISEVKGSIVVDTIDSNGEKSSYELVGSCEDRNAISIVEDGDSAIDVVCYCRHGFISSGGLGQLLQNESDYCVECMSASNIIVSSDQFSMKFNEGIFEEKYPTLSRHDPDAEVEIELFTREAGSTEENEIEENFKTDTVGSSKMEFNFFRLQPGYRYTVKMTQKEDIAAPVLQCPIVTSCSCDHKSSDRTGRPGKFSIYQENGQVMFTFQDNSRCGDAFSFSRTDGVDEFMLDATKYSTSFISDFYFNAAGKCVKELISPGNQAADDLNLSNLIVGKHYGYCVRSINQNHYMDHPYDSHQSARSITSSDAACSSHTVRWEASIRGKVTTDPEAGNIPIENVIVSWELLGTDFIPLRCAGCSGSTLTTDGGGFNIVLNVNHQYLKGKNDDELPVRIFFNKLTKSSPEDIMHEFLCTNGASVCDTISGHIVFLSHLQFNEPLHVYDNTSIPFEGRVFIADTKYIGEPSGCAISNAEVCIMHNSTRGNDGGVSEALVCVDTDANGGYIAPVVIGSRVDWVQVNYHSHNFQPTSSNEGPYPKSGLIVEAGEYYINNDFEDITKAEVFVEVVGGLCNNFLGESTVLIKVLGCEWTGNEYVLSGKQKLIQNIPAHFMHLEVVEILDKAEKRIENIYNFFQSDPPVVRDIELLDATEDAKLIQEEQQETSAEGNGNTGRGNAGEEAEGETQTLVNDGLEAEQSTVRFQYDGVLKMEVTIDEQEDILDCSDYSLQLFGSGESFHVIAYMTIFVVRVDLRYDLSEDNSCDIVDDIQIFIDNQVGIDKSESWETFFETIDNDKTRNALTLCSTESEDGPCVFNATHTVDDNGNKLGNAGLDYSFATGRPNIIDPYTKNIIFRTLGGTSSASHTAIFFIEGLYSKGPGNSFALPTHEPIMILRDPPGGSSYAKYENIQTTLRVATSAFDFNFGVEVKASPFAIAEPTSTICAGGGFGAIVLGCKESSGGVIKTGIEVTAKNELKVHTDKKNSNEFTTTWSYSTSDSPERAGSMSDVFVVPNLNVAYETVYDLKWSNETCSPIFVSDNVWPTDVRFAIESNESKPSIAFYSRFQLEDQKIPEIETTLANIDLKLNGHQCKKDDTEELCFQRAGIQAGLDGWQKALNIAIDGSSKDTSSIIDWFTSIGKRDMNDPSLPLGNLVDDRVKDVVDNIDILNLLDPLSLDDHAEKQAASIMPPSLVENDKAISLDNGLIHDNFDLRTTKRIQFDGGAGQLEMTMSKEKLNEWNSVSCWQGCNLAVETSISAETEATGTIFGIGIGSDFSFDGSILVEHTALQGGSDTSATSIGFSLGDPDLGDEFVVDIYFDKRYGGMVFNTISGRSACPHEINTLANEDPQIRISKYASPFVFPDEPMVFEVVLENAGVGAFSDFVLYPAQTNGIGGVSVTMDGVVIGEDGTSVLMLKDVSMKKQVVITRGPNVYQDDPIDITLQSKCEVPRTIDDLNSLAAVKLSNTQDENKKPVIQWVRPCPKVEWASDLKRDKGFLVNLQSEFKHKLLVTVRNPDSRNGSFSEERNDRLEHVYLQYRKIGSIPWNTAVTLEGEKLDFSAKYAEEDSYGYVALDWNLNGINTGNYEIKVESICTNLGGPDDINRYETFAIPGVIDLFPPNQYGQPLPLREEVIAGEEIVVVFTKSLDCTKPLPFDIEVRISNTKDFDKDNLDVRCEGRTIGFQIKLGSIPYQDLLGKAFEVEIGNIGDSVSNVFDSNGNALESNVLFKKTFADIDLNSATTSFRILLEDFPFAKLDGADKISDEIIKEIANLTGLNEISRISVDEVSLCHNERRVKAKVSISPPDTSKDQSLRRLGFHDTGNSNAVNIYEHLINALERKSNHEDKVRKLHTQEVEDGIIRSYSVSDTLVLPSTADMEKFHTESEEDEAVLYRLASFTSSTDKVDVMDNHIFHEVQVERGSIEKELKELESTLSLLQQTLDDRSHLNLADGGKSREAFERMFLYSCVVVVASIITSIAVYIQLMK